MLETEPPNTRDSSEFHGAMRDLAALAALSGLWASPDLQPALQGLADLLRTVLRARVVYVRLMPDPLSCVEAVAMEAGRNRQGDAAAIGRRLLAEVDFDSSGTAATIAALDGGGEMRAIAMPVNYQGKVRGTLIACADEPDFPAECDRVLLTTGVSQAAALLQRQHDDTNRSPAPAGKSQDEDERTRDADLASRRLAAIVESSDDAIIAKDLTGIITNWNSGASRIFGYSAAEIIGRPITLLIPADRQDEEPEILARICRGERVDHYETVRCHKDGSLLDISLSVSPIKDSQGKVVGASKIARDITARRRSEAQQQAIYELAAGVNRAVELTQIYDLAIEAICRCQQADRAAILLYDSQRVMRFKACRNLSEPYRRAVEGHAPWKPEDRDPQPVWIDDITQTPIDEGLRGTIVAEGIRSLAFMPLTYEGRLLGKFMIYYNARHRFSAEELRPVAAIASQVAFAIEQKRGAAALDALVNERTAALRQAIEQMEEFSYTVSHDLRAPVRAMCGYAEALLQDYGKQLDPEGTAMLTRIQHNSARMDRLITDLLTYTRISRRELKFEPVSVEKLVNDVVHHYPEIQSQRATVEIRSPLREVLAHEPSLLQVISNILGNAVKFVAPGTRPAIRVYSEPRENRVRVWFEDNGIGIKPEYQSRVFGMFERVHPHANYDGTGVGLAIVRKAIERMHGRVGLESDGIAGSKFWFELPAAPHV